MSTLDQHDTDLERALRDAFEVATEDAVRTPAPAALLARVSQAAHDDRVRPAWRTWGVGAAAALLAVAAGVAVWPHDAAPTATGSVTADSPTTGTTGSTAEPALTLAGYHVSLPPGYSLAAAGECGVETGSEVVATIVARDAAGKCLTISALSSDEIDPGSVGLKARDLPDGAATAVMRDGGELILVLPGGKAFAVTGVRAQDAVTMFRVAPDEMRVAVD